MTNRIVEILGIDYPLIQGPMALISESSLAAAVSNAGGLGSLCASLPNNHDYEIKETKKLTDKPFALNVFLPDEDFPESNSAYDLVDLAFSLGVKNYICVGRKPAPKFMQSIKERGGVIIYREPEPTVEGAKAAEAAGADIIVATSFDEGGGIPYQEYGSFSIIPLIVDAVDVPVMAAGSIFDSRTINAAFALGAEGVYVGSRFLLASESKVHPKAKEAIIKAKSTDLVNIDMIPSVYRSVPTPLAKKAAELTANGGSKEEVAQLLDYNWEAIKRGMIDGDLDNGIVSVSLAVDQLQTVEDSKTIIQKMFQSVNY